MRSPVFLYALVSHGLCNLSKFQRENLGEDLTECD